MTRAILYAISYDFWKIFKRLDIDHHSVIFLQGQGFDYFCHQYCAYQNTQILQLVQRVQYLRSGILVTCTKMSTT